jgi:arylformamidase
MRVDDYPPQEPLTDIGTAYRDECLRMSKGIDGTEIAYANEHPCQGILVFAPRSANGSVLVWMHGGGWTNGYKEMMAFMAPPLNEAGITFVTVGYRLAPEYTFPIGWLDAARAIRWVYANIAKFGGDPRSIFVGGHSAGAHYAALLTVTRDWLAPLGLSDDMVRGCLPISGTYYFTEGSGLAMRPRFLGPAVYQNELWASPLHHVTGKSVAPILLAHGDNDFPHLIRQAKEMEHRVRQAGGQISRVELPECNHFEAVYSAGKPGGTWLREALRFMASSADHDIRHLDSSTPMSAIASSDSDVTF